MHGVDLGTGATRRPAGRVVAELLEDVTGSLAGRDGAPALRLTASDLDRGWTTGSDPTVDIIGAAVDLLGWLDWPRRATACGARHHCPSYPPGSDTDDMVRCDVIVIGAGAMGSAAAWSLARRGRDVVLIEQYGQGHLRGSSHGGTRIFRLAYPNPLYINMAKAALPLWRELEDDAGRTLLETTGGVDHGGGTCH